MKRMMMSLLLLFFAIHSYSANTENAIPDELIVREHWISLTKSYDIETKTQKLGTLYRRFFSLLLTYDFYDPMDVKTATAKARFFSFGAHLDIYDQTDAFIGGVEEKIFTFFPTFEILGRDSATKLARAEMNFWGTKFYIYDPITHQEMAIMSRSFFRFKNDWTINVVNRSLLEQKNIDSRVLMTVLAVQGEIEDWQKDYHNASITKTAASHAPESEYQTLIQHIKTISADKGLDKITKPSQEGLEVLTDELEQKYKTQHHSSHEETNDEQIKAFTSFCLGLIDAPDLSNTQKKAIVTLLNLRLRGHS